MVLPLARRLTLAVLTVLALAAGMTAVSLVSTPPAAAEPEVCGQIAVEAPDGSIHYVNRLCDETPGDPGSPGGDGPSPADCGLVPTPAPPAGFGAYYCAGTQACAIKDNIVPLAPPTEPAPPGQEWVAQGCTTCTAGVCAPITTWNLILSGGAQPRPLIVQAMEAYGNLAPPAAAVQHSPNTDAVVGLDTWFWLDPATFTEEQGSSAEGLLAIATPDHTEWDPGAGSGTLTCAGPGRPYAPGADSSDACTHTYTAMSAGYQGQVTRHWTVRYENNGAPVEIPGAPAELTSPAEPFTLAVVETQVVGGNWSRTHTRPQ